MRRNITFTIDAPLDKPEVYEETVFLRRGGEGFNPDLRFRWNIYHPWRGYHDDGNELIRTHPELRKLYWAGRQSGGAYSQALEKKLTGDALAEAKKKRDDAYAALYQFAQTFRGPVNHLNPEVDAHDVQRLFYEYIEVEGPISEWPTAANKELFFRGEESGDREYARQIFARGRFQIELQHATKARLVLVKTSPGCFECCVGFKDETFATESRRCGNSLPARTAPS
jgi:hypothetical protein